MRAAVYSGTRNIYERMLTAAKSLLMHSNVDKVYFLIEDDQFPYELPDKIECINVSNQIYFRHDGPNFKNVLSYMVLIRAAYTKIFPDLDRILSIDVDTIVNENISELWDLDLTNYYLAAVKELEVSKKEGTYVNMGVAMLNLEKIREEKKDDELIYNLNTFWYRWSEQDAINQLFKGNILILPNDYNCCWQAGRPIHEKITHFAGIYDLEHFPHFDYYKNLSISELLYNVPDNFLLDIIIPTYNNKEGLKRTLKSIPQSKDINIIIVDDCSQIEYNDIDSSITFLRLNQNAGPGMARQFGLEHSHGSHILFLDTGDYFTEEGLNIILNTIKNDTYTKVFNFSYIYDSNNLIADKADMKMIGKVFKRSFIDMYHICFSKEGSYANEDYGFIYACKLIDNILAAHKFETIFQFYNIPVIHEYYDPNSLTKKNNNEMTYTSLISGMAINTLHAINIAKKYNLYVWTEMEEYSKMLAQEYYYFLRIINERPEYTDEAWNNIRNFYFKSYYIYKKFAEPLLENYFKQNVFQKIRQRAKNYNWFKRISINIKRFLHELETEELVPIHYY